VRGFATTLIGIHSREIIFLTAHLRAMSLLQQFNLAQVDADADKKIKAVGGKATLYKRSSTQHWQVRFKLANNKWHSQSTGTPNKDEAIAKAEHIYQTVQIKTEAGLSPITKTFKQIAKDELANMAQAMSNRIGKRTYAKSNK